VRRLGDGESLYWIIREPSNRISTVETANPVDKLGIKWAPLTCRPWESKSTDHWVINVEMPLGVKIHPNNGETYVSNQS